MNSSSNQNQLKFSKNSKVSMMDSFYTQREKDNQTPQSPTQSPRKRQKDFFLTKKPVNVIEEAKQQLHDYIDVIDGRIEKYVEKNQNEFLLAYRNHVKRLREEMEEIKSRTLSQANSSAGQLLKIQALEKQVAIFRDQSLKLFQRLEQKEDRIIILSKRLQELEKQNLYLENSLKASRKRNMFLEGYKNLQSENQTKRQSVFLKSGQSLDLRPSSMSASKNLNVRIRETRLQPKRRYESDSLSFDSLIIKIDSLLPEADGKIKDSIKKEIQQFLSSRRQSQRKTVESKETTFRSTGYRRQLLNQQKEPVEAKKSEAEEYFQLCIQTVRKQISRRKGIRTLNFYKQYSSIGFEEFKKLDFFRLMELLVSQEKIIKTLYEAIFSR